MQMHMSSPCPLALGLLLLLHLDRLRGPQMHAQMASFADRGRRAGEEEAGRGEARRGRACKCKSENMRFMRNNEAKELHVGSGWRAVWRLCT